MSRNVLAVLSYVVGFEGVFSKSCPNACSGRGRCIADPAQGIIGKCECREGYTGGDCSLRTCPVGDHAWTDEAVGVENAHNKAECSNRGICDRSTGVCTCDPNFVGISCNRMACPNDCNGHGTCRSMRYHATRKDPGYGPIYGYAMWDADMIQGCHCDEGYYGHDCALIRCPHGDDPFTTGDDNEVQELTCIAEAGSFHLGYKGAITEKIFFDDPVSAVSEKLNSLPTMVRFDYQPVVLTSSTGDSSSPICTVGGTTTVSIEFQQESGDVPMITVSYSTLTNSADSPGVTIEEAIVGNKEDLKCGGRGLCDEASGTCTCSQYYQTGDGYGNEGTKGDCSYAITAIGACPGEIPCSGHGVCSGADSYQCSCAEGWESGDCSERGCLKGPAWFSYPSEENRREQAVECSNMGWCDRSTGTCNCHTGFAGGACQYLSCPGTPACNGHGQCLDMAQLADTAEVNGDATAFTYGAIPNNVETWDFKSVLGCKCDVGWEGYDCSQRSCPTGDDFNTMYQDYEVQLIQCTALPSHTITLGFRQFQTPPLYGSSSIELVLEELNKLPSVGEVRGSLIHVSEPYVTIVKDEDPCRCADDGISAGHYTGEHGCHKHDEDEDAYCYLADPVSCITSVPTPSPDTSGSATPSPTSGSVTPSPTQQFPGSATRTCDPCSCAEDGISGGVTTDMYGCGFRSADDATPLCVVVDPEACTSSGIYDGNDDYQEHPDFQGAFYRPCSITRPKFCSPNGDLLLRLEFKAPLGDLPDVTHREVNIDNGEAEDFVFSFECLSDGQQYSDVERVRACADVEGYVDNNGDSCSSYTGIDCTDVANFDDDTEMENVQANCAATCSICDADAATDHFESLKSLRGTVENAVCNNRGICNHQDGLCSCFSGYGSSDGLGNEGTVGDCGYLQKYITVAAS